MSDQTVNQTVNQTVPLSEIAQSMRQLREAQVRVVEIEDEIDRKLMSNDHSAAKVEFGVNGIYGVSRRAESGDDGRSIDIYLDSAAHVGTLRIATTSSACEEAVWYDLAMSHRQTGARVSARVPDIAFIRESMKQIVDAERSLKWKRELDAAMTIASDIRSSATAAMREV